MASDRDTVPHADGASAYGGGPGSDSHFGSRPSGGDGHGHSHPHPTDHAHHHVHGQHGHGHGHGVHHHGPGDHSGSHAQDPHAPAIRIAGTGTHALAAAFEAELLQATGNRLCDLHWFRTDWQRGGAATAAGTWRDSLGVRHDVVVKVPVPPREVRWLRRISDSHHDHHGPAATEHLPVPKVFASDDELGPYDFAWVVMERLPHGPLATRWHPDHFTRIAEAVAHFHRAAAATPVDQQPVDDDWHELLHRAREAVKDHSFPERSRWTSALKEFHKKIDRVIARWEKRGPLIWIHGDLHPANAMSRVAADHGPVCLLDLAEVRVGHWLEDAVYLERLHWTRPDRLDAHPVKCVSHARKAMGLENGDWPPLATARRVLLASTAPAFRGEHHPAFLAASLVRLEHGLKEIR